MKISSTHKTENPLGSRITLPALFLMLGCLPTFAYSAPNLECVPWPSDAYQLDFYTYENVIGYTGDLSGDSTVYFKKVDGGRVKFGHITQVHSASGNIGREAVFELGKRNYTIGNKWVEKEYVAVESVETKAQYLELIDQMAEAGIEDTDFPTSSELPSIGPYEFHRSRNPLVETGFEKLSADKQSIIFKAIINNPRVKDRYCFC